MIPATTNVDVHRAAEALLAAARAGEPLEALAAEYRRLEEEHRLARLWRSFVRLWTALCSAIRMHHDLTGIKVSVVVLATPLPSSLRRRLRAAGAIIGDARGHAIDRHVSIEAPHVALLDELVAKTASRHACVLVTGPAWFRGASTLMWSTSHKPSEVIAQVRELIKPKNIEKEGSRP